LSDWMLYGFESSESLRIFGEKKLLIEICELSKNEANRRRFCSYRLTCHLLWIKIYEKKLAWTLVAPFVSSIARGENYRERYAWDARNFNHISLFLHSISSWIIHVNQIWCIINNSIVLYEHLFKFPTAILSICWKFMLRLPPSKRKRVLVKSLKYISRVATINRENKFN
jgi:hypothetical protein